MARRSAHRRAVRLCVFAGVVLTALPLVLGIRSIGFVQHAEGLDLALEGLERRVAEGQVITGFGEEAGRLLASASGSTAKQTNARLRVLFLRQLALLRQQVEREFRDPHFAATPREALAKADATFEARAAELFPSGTPLGWSLAPERAALRAAAEAWLRREAELAEEQALVGSTSKLLAQATSDMQRQTMLLQQQLAVARQRGPWLLSASWQVPGTPLQLLSRLQRGGRASLELSLSPDGDPVNAQAGMVQGIGPGKLGVSVNLGQR